MKRFSLKGALPLVVALAGAGGAFMTMSMQDAKSSLAPIDGWVTDNQGLPCNLRVDCADLGSEPCRVSYPFGEIAHMKSGTQCTTQLFRVAQ